MALAVRVIGQEQALRVRAEELADRLSVALLAPGQPGPEVVLAVTEQRLELRFAQEQSGGPVYVDFVGGTTARRSQQANPAGKMLARAVGYKPGRPLEVVDATAGLGRDAFLLACLGCRVTAIERSAVMAELLADGIRRAQQAGRNPEALQRLHLLHADAVEYLRGLEPLQRPAVVYLDPMFAHRAKSALAKKEMRMCRAVAGDDTDVDTLLATALAVARFRVVVKRWLHAPPLREPVAFSYQGRSIRFDVYVTGAPA